MLRKQWGKLDPAWRIQPPPSITSTLPAASETLVSLFRERKITSMNGIRRFRGPRSIEFVDGVVLNDVEAVICATGYTADFSLAPFIQSSSPNGANGRSIIHLYQNLFPP
jgi:dimethylaniline monooxygenase (N-oxide forming)